MPATTKAQILDALAKVQDPDLHQDIVSLGFVKKAEIEDGIVSVTINLTTPAC
ncbi:MAG: iron-sulfur cluster assembly protein, partial [Planctomycetota bacterium]